MSRASILKIILSCLFIIANGCVPASSSEFLVESDHPYANDFERTWTVNELGASEIRLHFQDLQLAKSIDYDDHDSLFILDRYGNVVETYGRHSGFSKQDFWTDWYKGDQLSIKLVTDDTRPCYGFIVDKKDFKVDDNSSAKSNSLAESDHPYANDFERTWTVSEPGASEIRLHFQDLQLAKSIDYDDHDSLFILDRYGNVVETYGRHSGFSKQDFWTDWYKGDQLSIKLVTDDTRPCYGFIVDKGEIRSSETGNPSEIIGDSKSTVSKIQSDDSGTSSSSEVIDNSESPVSEAPPDDTGTDENKTLTVTELTSSTDYSTLGQSVTLVAKVDTSSDETEEPFGTATFMDGTTPIGVRDLISGQATFNTSSLSIGSHSITAKYSGDINFKPSISSPFTLMVQEQPDSEGPSNIEEQRSTEQPANSEDESSTERNSPVKDILVIVSENPLVSGIILLLVGYIIQSKKNKK